MRPIHAIMLAGILIILLSLPIVFIARARVMKSDAMRIHIIQDMDNQLYYEAQQGNLAFADDRSMRQPVAGTVARGMLHDDSHLVTGKVGGEFVNKFPFEITEADIKRGQERYQIYCAPCHGLTGDGAGMISQRAEQLAEGTWTPPLSYHEETVLKRPAGHLYNTIANGIRNMAPYGDQISIQDRWRIVAYIRALQRSQRATLNDVPTEQREALQTELQ